MENTYTTSEIIPEISSLISSKKIQIIDKTDSLDIINHFLETHQSDQPFFIVNLKEVIKKINLWREKLPLVEPFYAVKCNPDDIIIRLMSSMDLGFDCASKNEIARVVSAGAVPEKIIFANPCKMTEQIKYARSNDIDMMTFDSSHELYKIKLYHPSAKLVIRIQTDDSKSRCRFNCKFGVSLDQVNDLLHQAKFMELDIIGVSFHVGSGCEDSNVYYTALQDCKKVYDMAKEYGFNLNTIDIGGGFPGDNDETFVEMANIINRGISDIFNGIEINFIAEPGRYFVTSAYTFVTSVINKKVVKEEKETKHIIYYLSESVYGSFNNTVFDHAEIKLLPFNERNEKQYDCTVYGPTCDSMDKITEKCKLPDLSIGEVIYIENMGAYTIAASSNFNGFTQTECNYIIN
jgi:diaminopimelate decarboxylase